MSTYFLIHERSNLSLERSNFQISKDSFIPVNKFSIFRFLENLVVVNYQCCKCFRIHICVHSSEVALYIKNN